MIDGDKVKHNQHKEYKHNLHIIDFIHITFLFMDVTPNLYHILSSDLNKFDSQNLSHSYVNLVLYGSSIFNNVSVFFFPLSSYNIRN